MNDNTTPSSLTVYQFAGLQTGPKLIVLGAVHGNETCGAVAIQKIRQDIEAGMLPIERGTLTPFLADVVQCQEEQFEYSLIGWKRASGFGDFPQAHIH